MSSHETLSTLSITVLGFGPVDLVLSEPKSGGSIKKTSLWITSPTNTLCKILLPVTYSALTPFDPAVHEKKKRDRRKIWVPKILWTLFYLMFLALPITAFFLLKNADFFKTYFYSRHMAVSEFQPNALYSGLWYKSAVIHTDRFNFGVALFQNTPIYVERDFERTLEVGSEYDGNAWVEIKPVSETIDLDFKLVSHHPGCYLQLKSHDESVNLNVTDYLSTSSTTNYTIPVTNKQKENGIDLYFGIYGAEHTRCFDTLREEWTVKMSGRQLEVDITTSFQYCDPTSKKNRCIVSLPYALTPLTAVIRQPYNTAYMNVEYELRWIHVVFVFILPVFVSTAFGVYGLLRICVFGNGKKRGYSTLGENDELLGEDTNVFEDA
ncbi:hypothetical protein BC829DRAFT_480879 [Chytridium lagenaria]|nr:hypothetical protein BC829DRAFT_480879 [Chytridium lagenaria]